MTSTVSAAGSATPKVHPVSLDFQYDEPDGDTKLSDAYRVRSKWSNGRGGGIVGLLPRVGPESAGLALLLSVGGISGFAAVRRSRASETIGTAVSVVRRRPGAVPRVGNGVVSLDSRVLASERDEFGQGRTWKASG